jgi:cyclic pyranopterin phosphate synthase
VRFIELMPVGEMRELTWDHVVPSDEILHRLETIAPIRPAAGPVRGNGPARYFRFDGARGSVGIITPLSHTYCGSCNRVRLTADGRLRTCLFGEEETDLRTPLREGLPLEPFFRSALTSKPEQHHLLQMSVGGLRALSQVGG